MWEEGFRETPGRFLSWLIKGQVCRKISLYLVAGSCLTEVRWTEQRSPLCCGRVSLLQATQVPVDWDVPITRSDDPLGLKVCVLRYTNCPNRKGDDNAANHLSHVIWLIHWRSCNESSCVLIVRISEGRYLCVLTKNQKVLVKAE